MFVRSCFLALGIAALLLAPIAAGAQQPATSHQAAGPRLDVTATAARHAPAIARADTTQRSAATATQRQSVGKPVALMVVGGAAIVLGAVIGDAPGTLFMIGGTVALLYGLYQYLQ